MQVLKAKSSEGFVIKDFKSRDFKLLLFYYYYYFLNQGIAPLFIRVKQTSFEYDQKSFLSFFDRAFATKTFLKLESPFFSKEFGSRDKIKGLYNKTEPKIFDLKTILLMKKKQDFCFLEDGW